MANMMLIKASDATYQGPQPIPETLFTAGKPTAEVWMSTSFAASGSIRTGIWIGEPGGISIPGYPQDEVFTVLSGRINLAEEGGATLSIGPGESCCIRRGWKGVWTNAERTRKCYVITAA